MNLSIPRIVKNWRYASSVEPCFNFQTNTAGRGRRFSKLPSVPYWEEAFLEFGLRPSCVEPIYENMTGNHYQEGAHVHTHIDQAPEGFVHTRCNLMLKKPLSGGNPVLDGEEVEVQEGDLWLCLASLEYHSSTPISGGERLVFSFGGLVPIEQINRIIMQ